MALRPGDKVDIMSTKLRSIARAAVIASLAFGIAACGNVEPWVKPYERDRLADPIMALDGDPVSSSYIKHVYEAREGARGGEGAAGGGCGCN